MRQDLKRTFIKEIWQSSLATGMWSREIARQRRQNVEAAFLCGILLQIGKPAVLQASVDIAKQKKLMLNAPVAQALMQRYQATVGAMLAHQWQLPSSVVDTICSLSGTQSVADPDARVSNIVETVKAAWQFAEMMQEHETMDAKALYTNEAIIEINFYQEDVESLLGKTAGVRDSMAALLL